MSPRDCNLDSTALPDWLSSAVSLLSTVAPPAPMANAQMMMHGGDAVSLLPVPSAEGGRKRPGTAKLLLLDSPPSGILLLPFVF